MFTSIKRSYGRLLATALVCASAMGCGQQSDAVYPTALVTAQGQNALAIGAVQEINGSYGAGCVGRQGGWSVDLSGAGALTNSPLSVQQNNVDCILTLHNLRIGATPQTSALYAATPPIALGSGYAATPSSFSVSGPGSTDFYANAALLPDSSFAANFVIQVVYSADPTVISVDKMAIPAVAVQGGVSIQGVPMPEYTASSDGLTIMTNLLHVVTAVTGSVALTISSQTGQTGEEYAVLPLDFGASPSYADVDSSFRAANTGTLAGPATALSWDSLLLVGESLASPVVRSIIISHSVAGIRAYQIIKLTISE